VETVEVDDYSSDSRESENESSHSTPEETKRRSARPRALRSRERSSHGLPQYDGANDDVEEHDDLGLTPARLKMKRRTSNRKTTQGRKEWWKVESGVVGDSDESEDELSFQ
jgi:hypothetical protein